MAFWLLIGGSVTVGVILGWVVAGVMEGRKQLKKIEGMSEKKGKE